MTFGISRARAISLERKTPCLRILRPSKVDKKIYIHFAEHDIHFGEQKFTLVNINLELKLALRAKYSLCRTLLYKIISLLLSALIQPNPQNNLLCYFICFWAATAVTDSDALSRVAKYM